MTTHLSARLTLASGAPPVRTLYLLPQRALLDRSPYRSDIVPEPLLDADPSQPRSIIWRITGDTGSVAFDAIRENDVSLSSHERLPDADGHFRRGHDGTTHDADLSAGASSGPRRSALLTD